MAASGKKSDWRILLQAAQDFTTHVRVGLLYMLHCTSLQLGNTGSKRPIDDKFAGNELREVKTRTGF
jgi:hypothetical protein